MARVKVLKYTHHVRDIVAVKMVGNSRTNMSRDPLLTIVMSSSPSA